MFSGISLPIFSDLKFIFPDFSSPFRNPVMTLKNVDFPEPFGPIKEVNLPFCTETVAPSRAFTPPKYLYTF